MDDYQQTHVIFLWRLKNVSTVSVLQTQPFLPLKTPKHELYGYRRILTIDLIPSNPEITWMEYITRAHYINKLHILVEKNDFYVFILDKNVKNGDFFYLR